eukprot:3940035-Rhodomonas_salina.1
MHLEEGPVAVEYPQSREEGRGGQAADIREQVGQERPLLRHEAVPAPQPGGLVDGEPPFTRVQQAHNLDPPSRREEDTGREMSHRAEGE